MPLRFSEVSIFLSRLEDVELRDPPFINPADKSAQIKAVTEYWFKSNRRVINSLDVERSVALLSSFLPERRTDRVYGIQATRLRRILGRSLNLSAARTKDLQAYEQSGCGDLGSCVERVLKSGGPSAQPPVSLDEVDDMLQVLAGLSPFSGPGIARLPLGSSETRDELLGNIFKRLEPQEAKWLIRLILKDLSPIRVNESLVLRSFHFLLPDLLRFQDDFQAAIALLRDSLQDYPECPDPRSERLLRQSARTHLRPVVGVKVGRPEFTKARSIEHCLKMLGEQKWVLERKYDGEYCEIHIDLGKSPKVEECITIFSKSGKDSTNDRIAIHKTLIDCLHLGTSECKIKRKAILLGELVAYSDEQHRVLSFDQIRKHVLRSGRSIGTDNDSQAKPYEHLAIVFFDLLLLDDKVIMNKPVDERRMWLREIYKKLGGRAWSAEWKVVDFSDTRIATKRLMEQFAASIAERCEGLILKPCDVPYFPLGTTLGGRQQSYIKLKKDYISDLGDEADFAIIGGTYNALQALKSGINGLKYTDFHLGCLTNKSDVLRFDARPRFKVVGTIQQDQCIPKSILLAANALAKFRAKPHERDHPLSAFDLEHDASIRVQSVFETPLVFEVLGSGFEKPSNANFLMLRHPRVKKLHEDRSWRDCVSMEELQQQAYAARGNDEEPESQETRQWIEKLERKMRRKSDRARTATPRSAATTTPATDRSTVRSANTSAAKTDLNGTTLISETSGSAKRRRGEEATPCPVSKRLCIDAPVVTPRQQELTRYMAPMRPSPLSEITNNSVRWPSTSHVSKSSSEKADTEVTKGTIHKNDSICDDICCPLNDAVFYLAPSLNPKTTITTLLNRHDDAIIISNLAHWDRDSLSHPPLTDTVAESQAYGDCKKVVLVNRKAENWRDEFVAIAKEIGKMNNGDFLEEVRFFDVAVLDRALCPREAVETWWDYDRLYLGNVYRNDKGMLFRPRWRSRRDGLVEEGVIWL